MPLIRVARVHIRVFLKLLFISQALMLLYQVMESRY